MAPGASVVPPPDKRTGAWLYVDVDTTPGRMDCRGDGCRWGNASNKTRARDHLVGCLAAKRSFPEMMGVLVPAVNNFGASPLPVTTEQLHDWRVLWVEAMCDSCLPLGFFEKDAWRAALGAVTDGRFQGPGDRRMLASTYVPLVAAKSVARIAKRIREADSSAVSMDGATVNRQGVYNSVNYSPLALLYATTRLGAVSPTGANLLRALKDSFQHPIMAVARLGASAGGGAAAPAPRWRRLLEERAPAVVSDSPSAMVRMRRVGVSDGTFVFGYGCAAQAGNLVAQDAAKIQPLALALRSSLCASISFMRCGRPRTLHAATVSSLSGRGADPSVVYKVAVGPDGSGKPTRLQLWRGISPPSVTPFLPSRCPPPHLTFQVASRRRSRRQVGQPLDSRLLSSRHWRQWSLCSRPMPHRFHPLQACFRRYGRHWTPTSLKFPSQRVWGCNEV